MSEFNQKLIEDAAEWIVRLDDPDANEATQLAYESWVNEDPAHGPVVVYVRGVWGQLGSVADIVETLKEANPNIDTTDLFVRVGEIREHFGRVLENRNLAFGSIAAGFLGVVMTVILLARGDFLGSSRTIYETEIGSVNMIPLPDGSKVHLNTDTRIAVAYSKEERLVELEKGEAHFDVFFDARRPFSVRAGSQIVQAVGTEFSVAVSEERMRVAVAEGRVLVRPIEPKVSSPPAMAQAIESSSKTPAIASSAKLIEDAILTAGTRAEFVDGDRLEVAEVPVSEIERELAWRHGGLIFDRARLEDVVAKIGNYTSVEIVISDPALREMEVGGYFRIGEVNAMLTVLEYDFGLDIAKINDELIEIRPSNPANEG